MDESARDTGRMDRRALLLAAGSAAVGLAGAAHADGGEQQVGGPRMAPPCGLYCGACDDLASGNCHGCGCACGHCAAEGQAGQCAIQRCAAKRRVEHCGACSELPCTELIGFCNDPIWFSHRSAIENLRRRARIGTEAWLAEQAEYWSDPDRKRRMLFLLAECKERAAKAGW